MKTAYPSSSLYVYIALKRLLKKKTETSDMSIPPSRGKQRVCEYSLSQFGGCTSAQLCFKTE